MSDIWASLCPGCDAIEAAISAHEELMSEIEEFKVSERKRGNLVILVNTATLGECTCKQAQTERRAADARIAAALASLEEEPLKEGDVMVLGEHRGVIVRVTEDGKGAQLFWDNASHDWLPVFAVPFLIRGGATIERAG